MVLTTKSTLRSWGNSIGMTLPKKQLEEAGFHVDDEIEVIIKKKTNPLKDLFGALPPEKRKLDTEKLLKEVDEELDGEW